MEQKDFDKIGIGITTFNFPERLEESIKTIPSNIKNVVIVNDGTPYDYSIYGGKYDVIQHFQNKGVAGAKNSALRYLLGKGCEHIFLMEDDILIKDENVFQLYIEAYKKTGIKHFNYALQGYGNAKRNEDGSIEHPMPVYCIDYDGKDICFYHWCSGPLMYIHRDCIEKIGFFDENFINIHEHVDYTARIIKEGLHPPFWYFADIASAHDYIGDSSQFRNTTIPKDGDYEKRLKGADIYFSMKHGYEPKEMPKSTIEDLLLYLLKIKP